MSGLEALALATLALGMAGVAVIDARTRIIPDALSISLILAGCGWTALARPPDAVWAVVGGLAGYWSFVALELGYRAARGRDGLGRGDAKLFAAAGTWCGAAALPFVAMLAALWALCVTFARARLAGRKLEGAQALAFGPYLAAATVAVFAVRLLAR